MLVVIVSISSAICFDRRIMLIYWSTPRNACNELFRCSCMVHAIKASQEDRSCCSEKRNSERFSRWAAVAIWSTLYAFLAQEGTKY